MALEDEVKSRIAIGELVVLTNKGKRASTILEATLSLAATDVQSDFRIYGGIEYNNSNADHVNVAVDAVIEKLRTRMTRHGPATREAYEKWIEDRLEQLSKIGARDRITPTVDGTLDGEEIARRRDEGPAFGRRRFRNLRTR